MATVGPRRGRAAREGPPEQVPVWVERAQRPELGVQEVQEEGPMLWAMAMMERTDLLARMAQLLQREQTVPQAIQGRSGASPKQTFLLIHFGSMREPEEEVVVAVAVGRGAEAAVEGQAAVPAAAEVVVAKDPY